MKKYKQCDKTKIEMEERTNHNQSVADFDNNHAPNQASSSSVIQSETATTISAQDFGAGNLVCGTYNLLGASRTSSAEDFGVNNLSCWRNNSAGIAETSGAQDFGRYNLACGTNNSTEKSKIRCVQDLGSYNSAYGTNCSTGIARTNSAVISSDFGTINSASGTNYSACATNNAAMIWKLRTFFSRKPSEVEMRTRNLSSSYQSVQNFVLQRRLSFDLQVEMENNKKSVPKLRRCYSGPARQSGGLNTNVMPPLPNNTVENSPRPQIAIESLPKHALSISPTTNNSSTNLLNNSSTNLRNNTNSRNSSMTTTFETTPMPSSNGISDQIGSSTSNGLHEILDTTNFNREIERLKTFEGWRVPFLSAAQMAEAGFYYTKKDDIVRCAFCGVEVGSWVEGDNPMVDHQRWSPACRFLRKLPVGNVPLTAADLANIGLESRTSATEGYDTCGSHATRQYGIVLRQSATPGSAAGCGSGGGNGGSTSSPLDNMRAIEKLGIQQMRPPAYPMFATNESRIASYAMWPISLKLKPNVLSEAGFFYTGKGDQTICYYCGGGLKDWEESDVPWEEHAKWFNRCNYVLSIKGKEYVDKVCNKKPEQDETGIRTEISESESASELTEPRNESEPSTSATSTSSLSEQSSNASSSSAVNGTMTASSNAANNVESAATTADSRLCKICYMEEMGILFLPCGHIVACPKCALLLTTCAVCRKPYSATVRAFLS